MDLESTATQQDNVRNKLFDEKQEFLNEFKEIIEQGKYTFNSDPILKILLSKLDYYPTAKLLFSDNSPHSLLEFYGLKDKITLDEKLSTIGDQISEVLPLELSYFELLTYSFSRPFRRSMQLYYLIPSIYALYWKEIPKKLERKKADFDSTQKEQFDDRPYSAKGAWNFICNNCKKTWESMVFEFDDGDIKEESVIGDIEKCPHCNSTNISKEFMDFNEMKKKIETMGGGDIVSELEQLAVVRVKDYAEKGTLPTSGAEIDAQIAQDIETVLEENIATQLASYGSKLLFRINLQSAILFKAFKEANKPMDRIDILEEYFDLHDDFSTEKYIVDLLWIFFSRNILKDIELWFDLSSGSFTVGKAIYENKKHKQNQEKFSSACDFMKISLDLSIQVISDTWIEKDMEKLLERIKSFTMFTTQYFELSEILGSLDYINRLVDLAIKNFIEKESFSDEEIKVLLGILMNLMLFIKNKQTANEREREVLGKVHKLYLKFNKISKDQLLATDGYILFYYLLAVYWLDDLEALNNQVLEGIKELVQNKTICKKFLMQCQKGVDGYLRLYSNKELNKLMKQWKCKK